MLDYLAHLVPAGPGSSNVVEDALAAPRRLGVSQKRVLWTPMQRTSPTRRLDGGCCVKRGGRVGGGVGAGRGRCRAGDRCRRAVLQAVAAVSGACEASTGCGWAVISRHSERQADLPRRWKRSIRRLNFVLANIG